LLNANHLKSDSILQIGRSLVVPGSKSSDKKVAAKVPAPHKAVIKVASAKKPKTTVAQSHTKTYPYTVRPGDSDWNIARLFGTSADVVHKYNKEVDWSSLQVGFVLQIPKTVAPNAQKKKFQSAYLAAKAKAKPADSGIFVQEQTFAMKVKQEPQVPEPKQAQKPKAEAKPPVDDRYDDEIPLIEDILALDNKSSSASIDRVIKKARSMRGTPYRYGSMSRSATDCSGFTSQVYASLGIKLPRTSGQQATVGSHVDRANLKAGDLIFFKTTRGQRISHVGIYVGNGKFIHASSGGGHVMESSLSDKYYNTRYVTARRVIKSKKDLQSLLQNAGELD
jgi:cell wall-associated NlpC family hydrolase